MEEQPARPRSEPPPIGWNAVSQQLVPWLQRYHQYTVFPAILGVALILRVMVLNSSGFDTDEARITLLSSGLTFDSALPLLRDYPGLFLHLALTKCSFILFGTSETSARLFPMLFSLATIACIVVLARQLDRTPAGYLAAAILAISPWFLKYSIVNRQYMLLTFMGVLTLIVMVKALQTARMRYFALTLLFLTLALLTCELALLFVLGAGLVALVTFRWSKRKLVGVAMVGVALTAVFIYAFCTVHLAEHFFKRNETWYNHPECYYYIEIVFSRLFYIGAALAFFIAALVLIQWVRSWRRVSDGSDQRDWLFAALGATRGLLVVVLFTLTYLAGISVILTYKIDRYLAALIPLFVFLFAIGTVTLSRIVRGATPGRWRTIARVGVVAACLILVCVPAITAFVETARTGADRRENYAVQWREGCGYIRAHRSANDTLIAMVEPPVAYYLPDMNATIIEFFPWENVTDAYRTAPANTTVWLITDRGRYENYLDAWQRRWIEQAFEPVWESEENMVMRARR